MWPWSGGYDFNAADNLESTLNQASAKLINLMSQRVTWAWNYLRYQVVKGQEQGWVGTEYDNWANQFNRSQRSIFGFIQQLAEQAFTVHNQSYEAAAKQGPTQRTKMQRPASAPPPGLAPHNSDPGNSNAQAATPDLLYKYSDLATGLNDQIRPFFAKTLAGVLDGQPTPAGNADSGLAQAITWFLRYQLLELDARVRIVGEAFELAGGSPTSGGNGFLTLSSGQLTGLIQIETGQVNSANSLVRYINQHGIDSHVWSVLGGELNSDANKKDPAYSAAFFAAFFNKLTPEQIRDLLMTYTDWNGSGQPPLPDQQDKSDLLAKALASAYAGGLNPSVQSQVMQWLYSDRGDRFIPAFLTALEGNPKAALAFYDSLSEQQFNWLVTGLGAGGDVAGQYSAMFMGVCAAAMRDMTDPAQADALYQRIAGPNGALSRMSQPDLNALAPQFGAFLAAYAALKLGPPAPGQDLIDWANQAGGFLRDSMQPFLDFLQNHSAWDSQFGGAAQSLLVSLVFSALTAPFTGPAAIAVGLGSDFLQSLLPLLQTSLAPPGNGDTSMDLLRESTRAGAQIFVIGELAMQNRLYYNGQPATAADIQRMLTQVTPDLSSGLQGKAHDDVKGWTVSGPGGGDLYGVMSAAAIRIDSTSPTRLSR